MPESQRPGDEAAELASLRARGRAVAATGRTWSELLMESFENPHARDVAFALLDQLLAAAYARHQIVRNDRGSDQAGAENTDLGRGAGITGYIGHRVNMLGQKSE